MKILLAILDFHAYLITTGLNIMYNEFQVYFCFYELNRFSHFVLVSPAENFVHTSIIASSVHSEHCSVFKLDEGKT